MRQVCIYLNGSERIVIYKEGGCQFESRVDGIGWIVDNDACQEWKAAMSEAQQSIKDALRNVETIDALAAAELAK